MPNYSNLATTATNLITDFGESISVETPDPTFDADAGTSSGTPTTTTGKGVFQELRTDLANNIQAGDMLLVSTIAVATDSVVIRADSTRYQVIEVGEINPAGTVLVYRARVRK